MAFMKTSRLHELFKLLTKSEISRLKKFIRSPFFTRRTDVVRLLDILIKQQKGKKDFPPKEEIFKQIFPNKTYQASSLRGTMSDLQELIEQFLMIYQLQNDKIDFNLKLSKLYRQRKATRHFQKTMKETAQLLEQQPLRDHHYFEHLLQYQQEQAQFQTATRRTENLNLQSISNSIDTVYLIQKLAHACTQLTHQLVYKTHYEYGLLKHLLAYIEEEGYLEIPAVAIYYYCYRFLAEDYNLNHFQAFKSYLFDQSDLFPQAQLKNLYLLAINFCIRKQNEGNLAFAEEGLTLYQKGLEGGFLIENGVLSRFTFNNVIAFAIRLERFAWANNFITHYQVKLAHDYRKSTVYFNQARLEYAQQNYHEAMSLLQNTEHKDLVNHLIAKTMLLKIYFELEELDLLESHLDSFQIFIRRREVSDYHRLNYLNIIKFVRKILALVPQDKASRTKLLLEIDNCEVLTEKNWLKNLI